MKLQFPVLIQIESDKSSVVNILVPDLSPNDKGEPFKIDIPREWIAQMNAKGEWIMKMSLKDITQFIQERILERLEEIDRDDDPMPVPQPIEQYTQTQHQLYLVKDMANFNVKKIKHPAVVLTNQGDKNPFLKDYANIRPFAYLVENGKFVMKDKMIFSTPIDLSNDEISELSKLEIDKEKRVFSILPNSKLIDKIIESAATAANRPFAHRNISSPFLVDVEFTSQRRSTWCARYLPTITKATVVFEFLASIPLFSSSVKMTENQIFPDMGNTTGDVASNVQSALFFMYITYWIFAGPGAQALNSIGNGFDDLLHALQKKICCKPSKEKLKEEAEKSLALAAKAGCSKFGFTLLTINFIFLNAAMDFQQINSLTERALSIDSVFPKEVLVASSWIQFWANQLNDPMLAASFTKFVFDKINSWSRKNEMVLNAQSKKSDVVVESKRDTKEHKEEKAVDLEAGGNLQTALLNNKPKSPGFFNQKTEAAAEKPSAGICLVM